MKKIALLALTAAASAIALSPSAHAQTTDTDSVTISSVIDPTVVLVIDGPAKTSTVNIPFTAAELAVGTYTKTSAAILGTLNANRQTTLSVQAQTGDSRATKIEPGDIKLNLTAAGSATNPFSGGVALDGTSQTMATYAQPTGNLSTTNNFSFTAQVSNADKYVGSAAAYTNTLTFTATAS